jgi:Family of unknown function (DUF6498)
VIATVADTDDPCWTRTPMNTRLTAMTHLLLRPFALILFAANLVPLVGVIAWGWDAFVLLMLYWLETAVIAFWTVLRIALLPRAALADLQIGSSGAPSSSLGLAAFFTLHAGIFMAVHFLFLWALFSDDWSKRIHGVGDFVDQMVVGTGLWVPLLVLFLGRGLLMLFDLIEPWLRRLFALPPPASAPPSALGPGETLIIGLYLRIFVMQVTIIIGAWFAMLAGSTGALVFLIAVKTAVDLCFQLLAERFHVAWMQAKSQATSGAE